MQNPQQFSPDRFNHDVVQDSARSGIEWHAMLIGLLVGVTWSIVQTSATNSLLSYLITNHGVAIMRDTRFAWGLPLLTLALNLAKGTTIGFLIGYRAHYLPYRHTAVVILALWIIMYMYEVVRFQLSTRAFFSQMVLFSLAVYGIVVLPTAINGTFLAQSFRRNRGVRIH
jgi:hypothetical protein